MDITLTATQFAKIVGLARRTVLAHIQSGIIQATLVGKKYQIELSEIEHFQLTRRGPGAPLGSGKGIKRPRQHPPIQDTFWNKVTILEPDKCWLWQGDVSLGSGYGRVSHAGKRYLAHRIAYILTFGPIPDKLSVCHHCDNPPCCNPHHLFVGTRADNMYDMIAKRRQRHIAGPTGEQHYKHKLATSDVIKIRELAKQGISQRKLASMFRINQAGIWRIIHHKTWKCIP